MIIPDDDVPSGRRRKKTRNRMSFPTNKESRKKRSWRKYHKSKSIE